MGPINKLSEVYRVIRSSQTVKTPFSVSVHERLMRWSLILQPYRFTIRVIPGKLNFGADFLSRHFRDNIESLG